MPKASVTTTVTGQGLGTDEGAQGEPEISCERFSLVVPVAVPDAPHLVAYSRHVSEFHQRRAARAHRIFTAVDPLLDVDGQVTADFLVEFAFVGPHGSLLHLPESAGPDS